MIPKELLKALRKIEITTNRLATEQLAGSYTSVFKGRGLAFSEVREYTSPRVYNLLNDPREGDNVLFPNTWVPKAALPHLAKHVASLEANPPVKAGQPDPYQPPK